MENKRHQWIASAGRRMIPVLLLLLPFSAAPENRTSGPAPVCDEPIYHFGKIDQSVTVTNVFVIRNDGDTTFVAGPVRTSCGCTQARISKRMIGPGETAGLSVVFSAARRRGPQKKAVYLSSADAQIPPLIVYMEGFVESSAGSD